MTKVSYIHGIGKIRKGKVAKPNMIDFTKLSEGELRLTLLAEQYSILNTFYPEEQSFKEGKQLLVDTLFTGLHRNFNANSIGSLYRSQTRLIKEIQKARYQSHPAGKTIQGRKLSAGIGDPLIPLEDCILDVVDTPQGPVVIRVPGCDDSDNYWKRLLNEHLEKSSHHLLYQFEQNPNAVPPIVAAKKLNHELAIAKLHEVSRLSVSNIKMWLRNGIMRNNAANGIEPFQPEASINILREGVPLKQQDGVGEITIGLVIALITAITGAIAATGDFIKSMKQTDQQRFKSTLADMGLTSFWPSRIRLVFNWRRSRNSSPQSTTSRRREWRNRLFTAGNWSSCSIAVKINQHGIYN